MKIFIKEQILSIYLGITSDGLWLWRKVGLNESIQAAREFAKENNAKSIIIEFNDKPSQEIIL